MSAQMIEVSLLAVGTVLHVEGMRGQWSNDEGKEQMSPPPPPSWLNPSPITSRRKPRGYINIYIYIYLVHSTAVRFCPPQTRDLICCWHSDWLFSVHPGKKKSISSHRVNINNEDTHLVFREMRLTPSLQCWVSTEYSISQQQPILILWIH